ncbi:hypothetical protein HPB50_016462 [Hyalomma asiaticum]|uniref:Uncharacterized protein n=1 Tax=Hyalomma asiaticum TaxID=266040 RepID=A0ACB7SQS5_HYAAI|nr:hypothetical protein HPB50_016462 [Hyalomma asiaticum]
MLESTRLRTAFYAGGFGSCLAPRWNCGPRRFCSPEGRGHRKKPRWVPFLVLAAEPGAEARRGGWGALRVRRAHHVTDDGVLSSSGAARWSNCRQKPARLRRNASNFGASGARG